MQYPSPEIQYPEAAVNPQIQQYPSQYPSQYPQGYPGYPGYQEYPEIIQMGGGGGGGGGGLKILGVIIALILTIVIIVILWRIFGKPIASFFHEIGKIFRGVEKPIGKLFKSSAVSPSNLEKHQAVSVVYLYEDDDFNISEDINHTILYGPGGFNADHLQQIGDVPIDSMDQIPELSQTEQSQPSFPNILNSIGSLQISGKCRQCILYTGQNYDGHSVDIIQYLHQRNCPGDVCPSSTNNYLYSIDSSILKDLGLYQNIQSVFFQ